MTPAEQRRPALVLRGIDHSYAGPTGPVPVLDGVDLEVDPGEVVAVAGRSGSGKTTLLTVATGWTRPDAGTVELAGEPLEGPPAWQDLSLLPQSLGLLEELTLAENVALPLRLAGGTRDHADGGPRVLLERLGLAHLAARYPSEVSLGEQQRAALARAAVLRPAVLVADEPISHQNRGWATVMVDLIRELVAAGTACVLATHDELALSAAHRVLHLQDGRLGPSGRGE